MKRLTYIVVAILLLVAVSSCNRKTQVVRNERGEEGFVYVDEENDSGVTTPDEEDESEFLPETETDDDFEESAPVEEPVVEEPSDDMEDVALDEDAGANDQDVVFDLDANEQLTSFKTTTVLTFVPEDGATEQTTVETAFIREPPAQYFLFQSDTEEVELTSLVDGAWARFNDQWAQIPPGMLDDLVTRFSEFLIQPDEYGDLDVGSYSFVLEETVEDILVSRFEGTNTEIFAFLVQNDETNVEISDGVVRFGVTNDPNLPTFLLDLDLEIPGTVDGVGVKFLITQETTLINQRFDIEAPTLNQMSGLSEDLPSYPKAYNMTSSDGKIYFNSDDSVEDVANFFGEALFDTNWEKIDEKGSVTETPLFSYYAKEDDNLAVIVDIGQDGSGSQTWIEDLAP